MTQTRKAAAIIIGFFYHQPLLNLGNKRSLPRVMSSIEGFIPTFLNALSKFLGLDMGTKRIDHLKKEIIYESSGGKLNGLCN